MMSIHFPLLIDGGHSTEMERLGYDLNHRLWTAKYLIEDPEAIINVHTEYLKAGARCITTFSYQASIPGFKSLGYSHKEAIGFIIKSIELAEEAIGKFTKLNSESNKIFIAASIGPYGASLSDGSEYKGNYGVKDDVLRDFHYEKIKILDNSAADFLAFETIPSLQEAKVLYDILLTTKTPSWISFSCKDGSHINDGTPIDICGALFADHPTVFAIGVNCTPPKYISELIKSLKHNSGDKNILVYPNSGEVYDPITKSWSGITDSDLLRTKTSEWLDEGADIVGGCCRLGSQHITQMKMVIDLKIQTNGNDLT